MSASLVGSEMCIRDREEHQVRGGLGVARDAQAGKDAAKTQRDGALRKACLLYTSDAADDM
eukprot:10031491-Alexandrium_andersonii.AAC.1